ncbi:MAG TPA: PAC2 family protein [Tepidisphaeraceae bacterium]|nr:PAC2 family protein [Tepidisphaeraceae bacterium]
MATPTPLKLGSKLPKLENATLLLALTGWMDGGEVSTGTVKQIMGRSEVKRIATIAPDDFYIYNFPGSMEIAALFRPHVRYDDGIVERIEMPSNIFWADEARNLVFFVGKEPNLKWQSFADCIFTLAKQAGVSRIVFMGSFGGSVPHTREPRLYGSVSHERLKDELAKYGVRLSDYEGPGSFASLLLHEAVRHDVEMLSFVAEIPGYLEGVNPLSIEAISKRLARMLNQPIDAAAMRKVSTEWENRVTQAVQKDDDLAATIRKLEEAYDNELIGAETDEADEAEDEAEAEEES